MSGRGTRPVARAWGDGLAGVGGFRCRQRGLHIRKELSANDLPRCTECVEHGEALIHLRATSLTLPPQAQINHVAPLAEVECFQGILAYSSPGLPHLGPVP